MAPRARRKHFTSQLAQVVSLRSPTPGIGLRQSLVSTSYMGTVGILLIWDLWVSSRYAHTCMLAYVFNLVDADFKELYYTWRKDGIGAEIEHASLISKEEESLVWGKT